MPVDELFVFVEKCVSLDHKYFVHANKSERIGLWISSKDRPSLPRISDGSLEDLTTVVRLYGIFFRHLRLYCIQTCHLLQEKFMFDEPSVTCKEAILFLLLGSTVLASVCCHLVALTC